MSEPPPVMPAPPDIFQRVFNFFSSVRLGVAVFFGCAVAFALSAIFLENPWTLVKHAMWARMAFEMALVFLILNIFAVMLAGYPWTRLKIGTLLVQAGLIVTFAGMFLTTVKGREGTVTLRPGEPADRYFNGRDRLVIKAASQASHGGLEPFRDFEVPVATWKSDPNREIALPLDDGSVVKIDRFYGKYRAEMKWREATATDEEAHAIPVARVQLMAGGEISAPEWVYDESLSRLPDGPPPMVFDSFAITYHREMNEESVRSLLQGREAPRSGKLIVTQPAGEPQSIEVQDNLGKPIPLEGGYTLTLERYLPNLSVGEDMKAFSEGDAPENPAIQIRVIGPGGFDKSEWLFHLKETPAAMGHIGLEDHFRFRYEFNDRLTIVSIFRTGAETAAVVVSPAGAAGRRQDVRYGQPVELHDGVGLAVVGMFEHPVQDAIAFNDAPAANPAIHVVWQGKGQQSAAWIGFNEHDPVPLTIGETTLFFSWTQSESMLPFTLELTASVPRPDGSVPVENTVRIQEPGRPSRERVISGSVPLQVGSGLGAWTVLQISPGDGSHVAATYGVSCDAGRPVTTFGVATAAVGLLTLAFLNPLLRKREKSAAPVP
ncbi:MAG: hypothetical protein K8T20_09610 [Planctomycetes bacterium]|nr:hypothetical protein [Planctomycetota bacterium]